MKRQVSKVTRRISMCLILVAAGSSIAIAQKATASSMVRDDIFAATTTDQYLAAYNSSSNTLSKIAVLQALPMAITRFKVTAAGPTVPSWLQSMLTDALKGQDPALVKAAVEQIGLNGILSYSNNLIALYGQNGAALGLRASIIEALGGLGTPSAIALIGQVVDAHQLSPETDMAIAMIGRLCITDYASKINSYVKDIEARMQGGEFDFTSASVQIIQPDPYAKAAPSAPVNSGATDSKKKPLVSPENSLRIAVSAMQMLGNGNCGR